METNLTKLAAGIVIGLREEDGKPAVLLQKRSDTDSFARGSQVSAHGKLSDEEMALPPDQRFKVAMLRKVLCELGPKMHSLVAANEDDLVVLNHESRPNKEVVTFGLDTGMPAQDIISMVELGGDAAGVAVCSDPKTVRPYRDGEKQSGVPAGETAMFPDEILSVTTLFEKMQSK